MSRELQDFKVRVANFCSISIYIEVTSLLTEQLNIRPRQQLEEYVEISVPSGLSCNSGLQKGV